jgi:hypothetical protein
MTLIPSFSIPTVKAECVMDRTTETITYSPPEEVDVIDSRTRQTVWTCHVPIRENWKLIGYILLPKQYREAWLELSYYIVMYTNVWRLWVVEEENVRRKLQKEKAAILHQNTSTHVVQHMHSRLLTVLELVSWSHDTTISGTEHVQTLNKWKVQLACNWFSLTYEELSTVDAKFLHQTPGAQCIEGKGLLLPDSIRQQGKATGMMA